MRPWSYWLAQISPLEVALALTSLIDVIFALRQLAPWNRHDARLLSNRSVAFGENHKLVARKFVFLDGLADDLF